MNIYLIAGQEFKRSGTLDNLNDDLKKQYQLVADPSESETELRDKYTPGNIRRITDPVGTNRFDFVQYTPDDSLIERIVVGKILDEGSIGDGASLGFWPASADLSKVVTVLGKLSKDLPQAMVYAVFAYPEKVKRQY